MGPLRPPSAGIPNYNTFDDKHLIGLSLSCNRIVVSTSRCGRDNPGSNPGYSIFYKSVNIHRFFTVFSKPSWKNGPSYDSCF